MFCTSINYILPFPSSVSMDRHICRLNNLALKAKSSLDERYLPTHVEYCSGFLIVITNGGQIKILNPETLNCRKVLRFDGIPQVCLCN